MAEHTFAEPISREYVVVAVRIYRDATTKQQRALALPASARAGHETDVRTAWASRSNVPEGIDWIRVNRCAFVGKVLLRGSIVTRLRYCPEGSTLISKVHRQVRKVTGDKT